jgi:hypothetical protein
MKVDRVKSKCSFDLNYESTQDSEFRSLFERSYGSTIFVLRLTDL